MSPDDEMRPRGNGDGQEPLAEGLSDPRAPWEEQVEDPTAPRRLLAVMFTDIVGSTELATAIGDKRWRELLELHDAAIRAEIARFEGTEVDTAGDAFFATFERPIQAVDCALEAARSVRRLGLRIRAGVHMGECVVSDGKVRGVSVHIGARVGAKARGDEVLISSTVRDVLTDAGLQFSDRGTHELKGVTGRWHLYAVEPRTRDNEADLPPLLEALIPKREPPEGQRRRRMIAAGIALVVLIAGIAFVVTRGGGLSSVRADSVAEIDGGSGTVLKAVGVRRRPVGVLATSEGVWVVNSIDRSVSHVTSGGESTSTSPVGASPTEVTSGGGLIWVANSGGRSISRIDPDTGREAGEPIQTGNGVSDISFGAGAVWITNAVDGTVWRIDPSTERRTAEAIVGLAPRGIAASNDQVWATSETAGTATRLDPRTAAIVRVVRVGNGAGAVAIGSRDVWVANAFDGTVSRIDPASGSVRATIRVGRGPRSIAIARDNVFVANETDSTVSMIRPDGEVKTIELRNAPMGLASAGDRVWVTVRGGTLSYRGGTLRVRGSQPLGVDPFNPSRSNASLDPSLAVPTEGFAINAAAYDGLTSFKKVAGVESAEVVPDLVEELRPPTNDGKTYSFTLRRGLRYSNGTPVRASDVRKSFERLFIIDSYGKLLVSTLIGADKCVSSKPCDLSSAIVTDDAARTVVLNLRQRAPDLPYLLAHPLMVILPQDIPTSDTRLTPVPGTGPYRIASAKVEGPKTGQAILERNPYFRSDRGPAQPDGYADRIEYRWGGTETAVIEEVKLGRADVTLSFGPVDRKQLVTEFPAQVHIIDQPSIAFGTLNTHVAPFDDIRVRRALNLAIDRRAISKAAGGFFSGEPTCQTLSKNAVGYTPYCPYTRSPDASGAWRGPNLDLAKRLVRESGTAGQRVTVWVDSDPTSLGGSTRRRVAPHFVSALRQLGFEASMGVIPGEYYEAIFAPGSRYQVTLDGWFTDVPTAASFVIPLLTCPATFTRATGQADEVGFAFNVGRFCSPAIDKKVEEAVATQSGDVGASAVKWAEVDRLFTDAAPWVSITELRSPVFASKRVGNVISNVIYGPLLTQMWVVEEPKPGPS